jgi:hypothetical protein
MTQPDWVKVAVLVVLCAIAVALMLRVTLETLVR